MHREKRLKIISYCIVYVFLLIIILFIIKNNISVHVDGGLKNKSIIQLFYYNGNEEFFDEEHSIKEQVQGEQVLSIKVPLDGLKALRVDFDQAGIVTVDSIGIKVIGISLVKYNAKEIVEKFIGTNDVIVTLENSKCQLEVTGIDPFIFDTQVNIKYIMIKIYILGVILAALVLGLVIAVLEYILNWSLLDWYEKYLVNNMKEKVLIIIIGGILILPTIICNFIMSPSVDVKENRTLAVKPEFRLATIMSYPTRYETYYLDHIPFKKSMVRLNSKWKYNILRQSPADYVIKGKGNWLFYDSKNRNDADTLSDYLGINLYSVEELEEIKSSLLEKQEYLREQEIEFYVMICPNKSQIYSEYMPDYYAPQSEMSKTDQLVEYLERNTDLKVVYPKEQLMQLKDKHLLYYKWDTHWNEQGAYVGFKVLMDIIQANNEIEDLEDAAFMESDKYDGDIATMMEFVPRGTDKMFLIDYKPEVISQLVEAQEEEIRRERYQANINSNKLVMFRDSYATAMIPYLSKEFSESLFVWSSYFDRELIKQEKPQVVIYEVVERYVDRLKDK